MIEKDGMDKKDLNVYTSVACNRTCNCLAISKYSGFVYYGGNCSVAVYSPKQEKILQTLVQHDNRVNCVALHEQSEDKAILFAGASCGYIAAWTVNQSDHSPLGRFNCHAGSVTCLSVVEQAGNIILASTGNDSRVKIWKVDVTCDEKLILLQDLDLKTSLAFTVHLVAWPNPVLTLAYTLENCSIVVNSFNVDTKELKVLGNLKGHEDIVTQVDSIQLSSNTILLASAGQDSIVRIWRLEPPPPPGNGNGTLDLQDKDLEVKDLLLVYPSEDVYSVKLESVLCGHEDKINAVQWKQSSSASELSLLTASLDKTTIIWQQEEEGVWTEKARFGEIGGNTLGIFGSVWGNNEDILSYSFSGAFHSWQKDGDRWIPGIVPGGHQGSVCDISWAKDGKYLMSVSVDQTTRCHGHCKISPAGGWHEVARPQVHGYDMSCIAALPNLGFVSGAEEKVLRAFRAPQNFLDNFIRLTGLSLDHIDKNSLPTGASLPTLGLSNKAVFEGDINNQKPEADRHVKDQFPDFYFSPEVLEKPPTEESLVQNTLWPEVHKMYGHGYEVYCVAASSDGRMVASACKSSQPQEAAILIWNTESWKQIGRIEVHSLTVTQLAFSPTADNLLSVSRDRSWALHSLTLSGSDDLTITKIKYSDKKTTPHKRIIWTCSWSNDGKYFYTGSRDKILACWTVSDAGQAFANPLVLPEAVTAVAGCAVAVDVNNSYILAVGLETGPIHIVKHNSEGQFQTIHVFNTEEAHHATVTRLHFCPTDPYLLASSSQDHSLKIYNLKSLLN